MPLAKWVRVVSFSSEDPSAPADNLVVSGKKWRCKDKGEASASVVLALDTPQEITSVHLGNEGSAFIEVQVGRAEDNGDKDMKTLLPSSSFMTPMDSRNDLNLSRVRMFQKDKLAADLASEKWDRVKVVCTQPFNKRVRYGIAFIQINVVGDEKKEKEKEKEANDKPTEGEKKVKLGAFTLKAESALLSDDYESVFAKRKLSLGGGMKAEMRNEKTLAAMALEGMNGAASPAGKRKLLEDKKEEEKPKFYQLKKENYKGSDDERTTKKRTPAKDDGKKKKLPRRDVMPGEDSPPRKKKRREEEESDPDRKKETKPKAYKPFKELLKGVVFTISGIQNPTRGEVRAKGIELGAKYRPDWDSQCTHLLCAFASTPKFNQVKKEGRGKIVKKDWLERCHKEKKRLPWRRFCLDPKDAKRAESEDEVWDERLAEPAASPGEKKTARDLELEDMDTDEEIEALERMEKYEKDTDDEDKNEERDSKVDIKKEKGSPPKKKTDDIREHSDSAYDASTDEDEKKEKPKRKKSSSPQKTNGNDSDAAFDAETDVDTENEDWPELPDFFSKTHFFLSGFSGSEERSLVRKVVAAGGAVERYMSGTVRFVVTSSGWNGAKFDPVLEEHPRVKFVKASFVHSCWKEQKVLSWAEYAVKKK